MAGFTPPAGQSYITPVTQFEKTPQFRSGLSTVPPGVTTPAVPATTVAVANTTTVDVIVYLLSGNAAVTVIAVNGVATGLVLAASTTSTATVYLPAGATITLTYGSTPPTWVWAAV
jgi:secreted trypsin-like serine protease